MHRTPVPFRILEHVDGMARTFELFHSNVKPELRGSRDVLLDARREDERVALRVHIQARRGANGHRGQNFGLEEGRAQFDKERRAAHEAVVKVDSDIETDKEREDENPQDGIRRGDGAQGGFETLVVGYRIEDESRWRFFGRSTGKLRLLEHFTKSHVLPATAWWGGMNTDEARTTGCKRLRTVGDDVYKSAPEARTLVLFALKELNNWDHCCILIEAVNKLVHQRTE